MKYPRTISRRDFIKALGLGGAVIGTAAVAPPVFHDLDEVLASPLAERKLPPWAREVDKPTVEIDWKIMKRFDATKTMFNPPAIAEAVGPEKAERLFKASRTAAGGEVSKRILEGKPGYTLAEIALREGASYYMFPTRDQTTHKPFPGPQKSVTPEQLGVPRWEGTPEENTRLVRAAAKLYGASTVGIVELDKNTRKLFYSRDATDGKLVEFDDVDEPIETDAKRVIPYKAKWAIVFTVRMSQAAILTSASPICDAAVAMGYAEGAMVANHLQEFLRTLGYQCMAESNIQGSLANSGGFGVLAGLGELSRLNRIITPEYGALVRMFKVVTDLPLAPTKPIDAGIWRFCRTCKACAEACPSKCLSLGEPSWEVTGFWNNPGVKAYYENAPRCIEYWLTSGTWCGICFAVCPFSKLDKSFMHGAVAQTIATTGAFNGTIKNMNTFFGYGQKDPAKWWDLNLPAYGYDNTQNM